MSKGYPFTFENVVALKRTALCVALIWPLGLVIQVIAQIIIRNSIPSPAILAIKEPAFSSQVILIAAILYIIAEVFNAGLELKKENEEFV